MWTWMLDVGESVNIADTVLIRLEEKSGRKAKLSVATYLQPIKVIGRGIDTRPIVAGIMAKRQTPALEAKSA